MADSVVVTQDDSQTCFGVHWNVALSDAQRQFEDWGFSGVADIEYASAPINGNDARNQVKDIVKRQPDARWYYVGGFDLGRTADSRVYKFSYTDYAGPETSDPAFKGAANYAGDA